MVPMLTCGLVRSNFAFPTGVLLWLLYAVRRLVVWVRDGAFCLLASGLLDDLLRDVLRNFRVGVELHRVAGPPLGLAAEVADVAEHLRERDEGLHDLRTRLLLHGLDLT